MKNIISGLLLEDNNKLSFADHSILNNINEFKSDIFNYSQKQLAVLSNVSEATVSRFIRKYKFKNYKDFLIYINKQIQFSKNHEFIYDEENSVHTYDVIFNSYKQSLSKFLDKKLIYKAEDCAKYIIASQRIILFGIGLSGKIAGDFYYNLLKIGLNCIFLDDFHILISLMANLRTNDLIIFVSNNFQNPESFFLLDILRSKKSKKILITSKNKVNYEAEFDTVLRYEKVFDRSRFVSVATKITQTIIIDLIFETLFKLNPLFLKKLNNAQKTLNLWKESYHDLSFTNIDFK